MIADKIKTRDQLASIAADLRKNGTVIGFTSGAFDILHVGHAEFLEKAKAGCDTLIIGIFSDSVVNRTGGGDRPLLSATYRERLIAALAYVDFVFLIAEDSYDDSIRILKPDIYFKSSDQMPGQEAAHSGVESNGCEIRLIPVETIISTTGIIGKMISPSFTDFEYKEDLPGVGHFKYPKTEKRPAVFLDRDGTINKEVGYISDPDKFEFLPNALQGMKQMMGMGYRLIIVTNQGGIDLGYFSKEDFYKVTSKMLNGIHDAGILIDKMLFCPHNITEPCECRKPGTGLIYRAEEELNIDLTHSYFIGDRKSDVEAGANAGLKTMLVGDPGDDVLAEWILKPDYIIRDLVEAAELISNEEEEIE